MKILWFTWKDIRHPAAGGAERLNHQLATSLVRDGHQVIFVVGNFPGGQQRLTIDGCQVVRLGNRYTTYYQAYRYYRRHLQDWPDLVIEEVNTVPYFTRFYTTCPRLLLIYQLCRQIWFYQLWFPLSLLGYLLEPFYLRLLVGDQVLTISQSSQRDLAHFGLTNARIFPVSCDLTPIASTFVKRASPCSPPTVISFGDIRPMKRTSDIWQAFVLAKKDLPDLRLILAGNHRSSYAQRLLHRIIRSPFVADVTVTGPVTQQEKKQLLRQAHLLLATSVKEGWGLIVSEAASQGTPSLVYDVDGLRDAVACGRAGYLCSPSTPAALAEQLVKIFRRPDIYQRHRQAAWQLSCQLTSAASYQSFLSACQAAVSNH